MSVIKFKLAPLNGGWLFYSCTVAFRTLKQKMNPQRPYIVTEAELVVPPRIVDAVPVLSEGPDKILSDEETTFLRNQGFTNGLVEFLLRTRKEFPLRMWIVDNSGSMAEADGHRIVVTKYGDLRFINSTRWEEIKGCVKYHIDIAALLAAHTSFRFLNDPLHVVGLSQIEIAKFPLEGERIRQEAEQGKKIMEDVQPDGQTPLVPRIQEIVSRIQSLKSELLSKGRRVAVVIATDGLPTDSQANENRTEFIDALKKLVGLPVWLVIRLCTDQADVVVGDFMLSF